MEFKNEREVEVKLLHPLFTQILGYPEDQLDWARPVKMNFGREKRTKEADLVAKYGGKPVITIEAKSPNEAVQTGLGQLDSYAFHLRTPYSVITNGKRFLLRGYYSFNSRINVIDDSVDALAKAHWRSLQKLISFENIPSTINEQPNPIRAPDEEKIKNYRRFFRTIHNVIRDRDKLDPAAAFDELSKLLFLKAAEDEWRTKAKSNHPVLTPEKIAEWESLGKGKAKAWVNEWFQAATEELFPGVFDDHPQINLSSGTLAAVLKEMKPFHVRNGDVDVIRAIISLPTHAFVQSGVPTVNTCIVYVQKFTKQKKQLYDEKTKDLTEKEIVDFLRSNSDFDYPIFMGTAEFIGYEPSGRMIVESDEKTDLDSLLIDFANQSEITRPDVDLFDFASRFYGDKSYRRKDQTIRGTTKGLKTAFVVRFAHAAGKNDSWWWPADPPAFWPNGLNKTGTLEAFVEAYATIGFAQCGSGAVLEAGFEKVAIYVDADGFPAHAARQLTDGSWTSKLGEWEDIQHKTLEAMEDAGGLGLGYGKVALILKRKVQ